MNRFITVFGPVAVLSLMVVVSVVFLRGNDRGLYQATINVPKNSCGQEPGLATRELYATLKTPDLEANKSDLEEILKTEKATILNYYYSKQPTYGQENIESSSSANGLPGRSSWTTSGTVAEGSAESFIGKVKGLGDEPNLISSFSLNQDLNAKLLSCEDYLTQLKSLRLREIAYLSSLNTASQAQTESLLRALEEVRSQAVNNQSSLRNLVQKRGGMYFSVTLEEF